MALFASFHRSKRRASYSELKLGWHSDHYVTLKEHTLYWIAAELVDKGILTVSESKVIAYLTKIQILVL